MVSSVVGGLAAGAMSALSPEVGAPADLLPCTVPVAFRLSIRLNGSEPMYLQ